MRVAILMSACVLLAEYAQAAADCVWKDQMTAAEVSACRDASVDFHPPAKASQTPQEQALLRESEQHLREEQKRAEQRREERLKPKLPYIGMSAKDAEQLPFPWGKPNDINVTTTALGKREQWVYTNIHGTPLRYLYFVNETLSAIQE